MDEIALDGEILEKITYTIPPSRMDTGSVIGYKNDLGKLRKSSASSLKSIQYRSAGAGGNLKSYSTQQLTQKQGNKSKGQKLEWNVNSSKESSKENVATFSPVKSLNRLVSLLQICAVSFFAMNQDLTLKIGYSLAWLMFIIIGIAIETPCLFNCYIDPKSFTQVPLTPDFLQILADFITLIHAISTGFMAFRIGGDLRRCCHFLSLIYKPINVSRTATSSKICWTLKVYFIFIAMIISAALQCFLVIQFNPRRIFRPYTPDREKLNNAKEGQGNYEWEYTPVRDVGENVFMYASLLFRGFLVIHVRSLDVITILLSHILESSKFSTERPHRFQDNNEKREEDDNQKNMLFYLNKAMHGVVFMSLLFNLLTALTNLVIVTYTINTVYMFPSANLYDLFKAMEALFFILIIISSLGRIHVQISQMNPNLKVSFPTVCQLSGIFFLVILYGIFIAFVVENTQNFLIHTEYYHNESRDWLGEFNKKVTAELFEEFKKDFARTSAEEGKYQLPEYYESKVEKDMDAKEQKILTDLLFG